ncbi:MAG: formate dehydrogenase accessory sulfurtransferase FdhD [Acidimicrobiales bacterium]
MSVRHRDGAVNRVPDTLIVEEPMEIRLDEHLVTTTMRTPGHDFELAVGFCHGEGLLGGAAVNGVRYCGTGSAVDTEFNVVSVSTGGWAPEPAARLGTVSSSCGLCGSTAIDALTDRLDPVRPAAFDWSLLGAVAAQVTDQQELFAATGASHAAAAFTLADGAVAVVREDIGRHNAVDKVVGRLLLDGHLPALLADAPPTGLWVSGRASFEMVQKAWAGGFAVLASVSAPSALAVDGARRGGIALAGFARGDNLTVYTS